MIVTLNRKELHIVGKAIHVFREKGYDVFVRENQDCLTLAVLGKAGVNPQTTDAKGILGVKKCSEDNKPFLENHDDFVEAWEYVGLRESRSSKIPSAT